MKMRRALILVGLIGLALIVVANVGDLGKLADALTDVSWTVIPAVIIIQILSYHANAGYYRSFFRMTGREVNLRQLFEISIAVNFANQVIPAGGVAGTTFLAQAVHPAVPPGQATLSQLGRYIFTFLSYFAVMAVGFILLFFGGGISKVSVRLVVLIMLGILVGALILMVVFSERQRLEAIIDPFIKATNWFGKRVLRRKRSLVTKNRLSQFLDDFYEAYHELATHRKYRVRLLGWSLLYNVWEVGTVYVVFACTGHWINPGIVIGGYTFAVLVSTLGFFTNGIGAYEAGMIGTFTALGQPLSLSVAVVLLYRGLSMIFFLPPGLYYYRKYLKTDVNTEASVIDEGTPA